MFDKEWADCLEVPGYPKYRVSREGNVYSNFRNLRIIKLKLGARRGYPYLEVQKKPKTIRLLVHRLVYSLYVGVIPIDKSVDHINRNKADNRVENLRLASRTEQSGNTAKRKTKACNPYRGITCVNNKWQVIVSEPGKPSSYRSFDSPIKAAVLYDLFALKKYGNFACTNFLKTADML